MQGGFGGPDEPQPGTGATEPVNARPRIPRAPPPLTPQEHLVRLKGRIKSLELEITDLNRMLPEVIKDPNLPSGPSGDSNMVQRRIDKAKKELEETKKQAWKLEYQ